MTENKHTPGPWEIGRGGEVYAAKQYQSVAMVCLHDEGEANAHLIAAAPDLLACLKLLDERGHTQATWELCLRAIAKAEGQS